MTLIIFHDIVIPNLREEYREVLLILKYILKGFNPNDYEKLLELLQSAPLSLFKNLTEYNSYLLSDKVVNSKLDEYDKTIIIKEGFKNVAREN